MGTLRLHAVPVAFERLAKYGDFALLERLAQAEESGFEYPLLSVQNAEHVSASPYLIGTAAHEAIADQNPDLPTPPENCRYIITGQQAGLLTGPLYTVLKAMTTILLSRKISETTGEEIRPLFWIASEDHDVLEVNRCFIGGHRFVHDYEGELSRGSVPQVADISLSEVREPLLAFLDETLRDTEFKPQVLDLIGSVDFSSYPRQFRDIMWGLFNQKGLRFVDPIALRSLTAPVLADLVERWAAVDDALARGSDDLRKHGFDPPLASAGFFEIVDQRRVPVRINGTSVTLSNGTFSLGETADMIREHPQDFSTGAALRPVVQDAVLPVLATVGGPTELKYLWQIVPIYEILNVRPSLLFPRVSATFLEPGVVRSLKKTGMKEDEILDIPQLLENPMPKSDDPVTQEIENRGAMLVQEIDKLCSDSPPRWLRSSRDAIASSVARIVDRLRQERAEKEGIGRSRLERMNEAVFPMARLQERTVNVLQFLNFHGFRWIDAAMESLDPFVLDHQIVTIREESSER